MQPLTFNALDDLCFRTADGAPEDEFPMHAAEDLGPVLELAFAASAARLSPPTNASWLRSDVLSPFLRARTDRTGFWLDPSDERTGLLRLGVAGSDTADLRLSRAAQVASAAIGFPKELAAQVAAALGELIGNIKEHSKNPQSGVAAFRARADQIELVVMDRGDGVLKSLRSARRYAKLDDHIDALELTLTQGVSRFENEPGRGQGFNPLFIGLANLEGTLRFRSGDAVMTMQGLAGPTIAPKTGRRANADGFFVSVGCHAPATASVRRSPPRGARRSIV